MVQPVKQQKDIANPDDSVELASTLRSESLPSRVELAHPKIYLSKALNPGQTIVAASHAALAWHLKYCGENTQVGDQNLLHPSSFSRVDPGEFEKLGSNGTYIKMTESRLGGKVVSMVGMEVEALTAIERTPPPVPEKPLDPLTEVNLKMYILIRRSLSFEQSLCAAANAAVAGYAKYSDDEFMRRWVSGTFYKAICSVTESEFEKGCAEPKGTVVNRTDTAEPAAVALCPRPKWPGRLQFHQLYR